jgi:hypothetical protein
MVALASIFVLVGLWLLVSALLNWEWYESILEFRLAEAFLGGGFRPLALRCQRSRHFGAGIGVAGGGGGVVGRPSSGRG